MPYIGRAATNTGNVRYLDNIASGFDGSDTTFTAQVGGVSITPDQENVRIYLDGVFQHPGSGNAYTIGGSTITFTEAPVANTVFSAYVVGAGSYLDDKAVSSAKLDDDAVTAAKLDDDGTGFQVGDLGVGGSLTSGDKLTITGRARVSGGIIGDLTGDVTGDTSGSSGSTTGNAATATALATARAINGVNFDGSAAITVTADANTLSSTTLKSTVVTSSLTSVGTIGTGVWNGTAVASAYLDADTAHLSGAQTFTGVKSFSNNTFPQLIIKEVSGAPDVGLEFTSGGTGRGRIFFKDSGNLLVLQGTTYSGDSYTDDLVIDKDGKVLVKDNLVVGTTTVTGSDYQFDENLIVKGTTPALILDETDADGFITMYANAGEQYLMYDHSGSLNIKHATTTGGSSGTDVLTLSGSGNATFANEVTLSSTTGRINIGSRYRLYADNSNATAWIGVGSNLNNLKIGDADFGTPWVTFASGGNTTFAGNIGLCGTAPNAAMALNVEYSTTNYIMKIQNDHATDGHGVLIRAGDDANVESFHVQKYNNTSLFKVQGDGTATFTYKLNCGDQSSSDVLFASGGSFPVARINNMQGGETGIRFRSYENGSNQLHADIKVQETGNETGTFKICMPHDSDALVIDGDSNATFAGQYFRIDAGGADMAIACNTDTMNFLSDTNNNGGAANLWTWESGNATIGSGTRRMTIDSNGYLHTQSNIYCGNDLKVAGNRVDTNGSTSRIYINGLSSGGVDLASGGGNIFHNGSQVHPSDKTLKKSIAKISNSLNTISSLDGKSFRWKDDRDDIKHYGIIAQEVEKILPELVITNEDEMSPFYNKMSVNYIELVPIMIEAIKELSAKVTELENA
tara:strand:- start:60 stop:2624 length:2565 start_codon:yes stop_codon:yes gene_type:complete